MIFWILVAALSALVTFWITRPLLRAAPPAAAASNAADVAVYKDQLAEIEADLARGQLSEAEAESARAEVSRRLIRLPDIDEPAKSESTSQERSSYRTIYTIATVAVPVFALVIYLAYGTPGMPGAPLAERLATAPDKATPADLVAKVEARLRAAPNDGKGWDVIAPVYASLGRFDDAVEAYANAIRLLGETSKRLEGMAIADIRGANGIVSKKARAALQRAKELAPDSTEPRLWLAYAKEQDGDIAGAIADYKALLAKAPEDAAWRAPVTERLKQLEAQASGKPAAQADMSPEASGDGKASSGSQPESAVAGLPAEQRAMIDQMVARLAGRLKENGNDLEGWLKLMRALKVLGRDAEATTALSDARKQFAGDSKALEAIDGLAKSLGLGS
ncbi:MAG: c-type cytochrome biogenesis protein CcmI [Hyphomicrobium sp.]